MNRRAERTKGDKSPWNSPLQRAFGFSLVIHRQAFLIVGKSLERCYNVCCGRNEKGVC
jgi:hypothetical protein